MAMLPFCGYNMADYFRHWLGMGKRFTYKPRVFSINWFRTDDKGRYLWPGFGNNVRVLKWVIDRVHNRVPAEKTPIGLIPYIKDIDLDGLNIPKEDMEELFRIDRDGWLRETDGIEEFFKKFGDRMPKEIWEELHSMKAKLARR